ncbi:MAG: hypothetical protein JNG84_09550, partial [Archangium sp.]|nr:hypothetical protein [Archangium sp.]
MTPPSPVGRGVVPPSLGTLPPPPPVPPPAAPPSVEALPPPPAPPPVPPLQGTAVDDELCG